MTDPAFEAKATAAGFTQQQSSLLETVQEAVSMARPARDQLSAQVVQQQQQQQQQQQTIQVSTPSGHIKLDSKLGRPPALVI
eukprot:5807768-Amphidinium_carterae.2